MKKTEKLLELIRKVVREEVRAVIKEELTGQKQLTKEAIQHGMNLHDIANSPKPYLLIFFFVKNALSSSINNNLLSFFAIEYEEAYINI